MADNSNNRKKTLLVGLLAFLAAGGGVFLFFIIQASNDLTGVNKKGVFTYGGVAREATTSFFKFIGFDDVDSIAKEGPKERLRMKEYAAAGILDETPAAAEEEVPWAPPAASGSSSTPSYVPKMGAKGGSGVGGMGGGGTKSTGGTSRFSAGSTAGNTNISGRAPEAGTGEQSKGTLGALKNARAALGDGLRSGSATTAKGKWDASFGVGRSASGGGDMAYGKTGLVNLDKIKKGEIDNLKTTDPRSLKTPEPGAPEHAKEEEKKDPVLAAAKEAAEDAIAKSMASSMAGAVGQGITPKSSDKSRLTDPTGRSTTPGDSGVCTTGSSAGVCSAAATEQIPSDKNVSYTQVGANADGPVYEVAYDGSGKGITAGLKGQDVNYRDTAIVQITKDGPKILTMGAINETAVPAP